MLKEMTKPRMREWCIAANGFFHFVGKLSPTWSKMLEAPEIIYFLQSDVCVHLLEVLHRVGAQQSYQLVLVELDARIVREFVVHDERAHLQVCRFLVVREAPHTRIDNIHYNIGGLIIYSKSKIL